MNYLLSCSRFDVFMKCTHTTSVYTHDYITTQIIHAIAFGSAIQYYEDNMGIRFFHHSNRVLDDHYFTASPVVISSHPSYRVIVNMGTAIIPLLIFKLQENPTYWFMALREITNQNPVPPEHKGLVQNMVNDWNKWASSNGYIS